MVGESQVLCPNYSRVTPRSRSDQRLLLTDYSHKQKEPGPENGLALRSVRELDLRALEQAYNGCFPLVWRPHAPSRCIWKS